MAGGQERILRRRIKSVQATKKITRAMELIAASRIAKAQQRVAAAVPYSERITEVVHQLSHASIQLPGRFACDDHLNVIFIENPRILCQGFGKCRAPGNAGNYPLDH